jgi:hypothetical protein
MKRGFLMLSTLGACAVCAAPASASVTAPPASCDDVVTANPSATDGNYTIYPNGEMFTVYCADMSSAPKEYLTLQNTSNANYSTDVDSSSDTLTTDFTKIRLDPSTLQAEIGDTRFSSTSGWVNYNGNTLPQNYAVASACGWTTGYANVDLTGTPFDVNDTFTPQGWGQYGDATFSSNNKVVNITGGGDCGDNEPSGHTYLQLGYNGIMVNTPAGLQTLVGQFSTNPGVSGGLDSKLDAIAHAANADAKAGGVHAFINQVNAQTGKALTADQALTLIELVQAL